MNNKHIDVNDALVIKDLTRDDYELNSTFIKINVNEFYINYMLSLYKNFDGDLLLPVILGVVAHHTIARVSKFYNYDARKIVEYMKSGDNHLLLPCNALSISEYTGIPRETVRRKLAKLIQKGWLRQNEKSEVFLDPSIQGIFDDLSFDVAHNVVNVAALITKRVADSKP